MNVPDRQRALDAYAASHSLRAGVGKRREAKVEFESFLMNERIAHLREVAKRLSKAQMPDAAAIVRRMIETEVETTPIICLCGYVADSLDCRSSKRHPHNQRSENVASLYMMGRAA